MRLAEAIGVGTGSYERESTRAIIRAWQEAAHVDGSSRKIAAAASPEALGAMGIGMRVVPTPTEVTGG